MASFGAFLWTVVASFVAVPDDAHLTYPAAKSVQTLSVASFGAFSRATLASFGTLAAIRRRPTRIGQPTTDHWHLTTGN